MSLLYLAANQVLGTPYGHLQLVLDPDEEFGNGDERELQVVAPNIFATGNWKVEPEQPYATPGPAFEYELELQPGEDASSVWEVLVNARDFFAATPVDYRLGLTGSLEGQNSNTFANTLAHIAGLDIAAITADLLTLPEFIAFPGLARNVLFDHHGPDGSRLPPVALDLDGSNAGGRLQGGKGGDTLRGGTGGDTLRGFGGSDTLEGQGGRDRLNGGNGADTLSGGAGRDLLAGGKGRDILEGGAGNDRLKGGAGADVFVFDGLAGEGADVIAGFADGRDLIRVAGLTFDDIEVSGGATAVVTLDGMTEITLKGIAAAAITAADFDFV